MSTGDLLVLASAVAFTFQILLVDHFSPKVDIIRLNLIQFKTDGFQFGHRNPARLEISHVGRELDLPAFGGASHGTKVE